MGTYIFVVKDLDGSVPFDKDRVCEAVKGLEGACACKEEHEVALGDMVLECEYFSGQDATTIYIPLDLKYVTIGGVGEASLDACLRLQRRYGESLHAIVADDPSCHVELTQVNSIEELRRSLDL